MPRQAIPQEHTAPRSVHRAFVAIDLEPQPVFQEVRDAAHDPLAGALTAHVDVAVIGVPAEAMPSAFQLPIQLREQHVGQQRRQYAGYNLA